MRTTSGPFSCLVVFVLLAGNAAVASANPTQQELDNSVQQALHEFSVPGMVVAIVQDGKVVSARGYGVIETGSSEAVDEHTLFRIGSVSKAFTTAALALLVDDGLLGWDDRVIDYIPEFRMQDPWVTREFTLRDLLTHRSGLPLGAGDLLLFPDGNATVAEIIGAFRYLEPSSSFRSEFAYDNLLYIVAGEVVARVAGQPFERFVESRLLAPAGMRDCVATAERAPGSATLATPHVIVDGELQVTTTRITEVAAAAGGIACSASGMAKWAQLLLNEGMTADGDRLISEKQFAELTKPVTLLPVSEYLAEHAGAQLNAYALGWGVSSFYGEPMLSHGGGVWGMTTFIAVLPEQGLAVFASGNQMSGAPRAVVNDVIDRFLRGRLPEAGKDWLRIIADVSLDRRGSAADIVASARANRAADSKPALPLDGYAGTYRDEWYGEVTIELKESGMLWFRSTRNAALQGPLEHFQYDTFVAHWTDRRLNADAYVTFSLAPDGRVEGIRMQAVSPATDFSFDFHHLDLRRVTAAD